MKRILLLLLAVTFLTASACTSSTGGTAAKPAGQQTSAKPNFVFVLTDDLAWNLIGHMPQVQALQKHGTTFSNYYVVDSLCCPSRSAIFTGQYPHDDGVFTNSGSDGGYAAYNKNGDQQKSFAVALQKSGYRTGMMGKYLNGYQPKDPVPPGWNEWDVAGNGYPEFNYTLNENGKQQHYGHDPKDYLVDVLSGKAGRFIDSSAAAKKPFMLEVATFAPHAPYTPAPRYQHAAKNVAYPKTPAYNTLPSDPPSWLKNRTPLTARQQKQISTAYRKRVEADMAVDDMIGHLEKELQAKGVAKNTYFVFSSDNGYHMGEYRLLPGKQTAFDTDIHVPLVVAGPGVPAGHAAGQLASNIDLCPTFEDLGGARPTGTPDGVSLAPLLHGQQPGNWQKAVLIEHHGPNDRPGDPDRQNAKHADPPSYEAVRTAHALYVRYSNGEQEYYDTVHDPNELHNLAGRGIPPAMPKTLNALSHCHNAAACQAAAR
jgi:arylsulfatase A-like enzyme